MKTTSDAMGSIEAVDGKTLTIKQVLGSVTINIDSASQITVIDDKNQSAPGKLADLLVGDSVKATYDKATKNSVAIFVTKKQAVAKKTK
ncbi:MAG: hypothetical protein WCO05_00020 [Candidatus Moraniibacteriota bacterium]